MRGRAPRNIPVGALRNNPVGERRNIPWGSVAIFIIVAGVEFLLVARGLPWRLGHIRDRPDNNNFRTGHSFGGQHNLFWSFRGQHDLFWGQHNLFWGGGRGGLHSVRVIKFFLRCRGALSSGVVKFFLLGFLFRRLRKPVEFLPLLPAQIISQSFSV